MTKQILFLLNRALLLSFFSFIISNLSATPGDLWTETNLQKLKSTNTDKLQINAKGASYYNLDFEEAYQTISVPANGFVLNVPLGDGRFEDFKLVGNTTMNTDLAAKYSEIKSFNIVSLSNTGTWGKLDISPQGLRIMIAIASSKTVFIDPVFQNNTETYIVYTRSMYISSKEATCLVDDIGDKYNAVDAKSAIAFNDCELKTYRLAVAATGEYTQFHGGNVSQAFAAIVTTINRVNMVYERDFSVTLELIESTDELIYTNSNSDPYTNGSPGDMINENQNNVNAVIGSSNYDIGHVFGTNSGGLAGLGVVCGGGKARGVTGSGAPIGDSFDIDYVAHEIGHQFGANHTFNNSCQGNRTDVTAMEPGSGSTIMAYAGICSPDVQNFSDDYFHGISMQQIGIEIESHGNCPVVTNISNVAPQIQNITTDIYIPASTPFALTAIATDADGTDVLTYCWEQMDNDISSQPPLATSTGGPNFRSFQPSVLPTRYFPNLSDLSSSAFQTWERLPSVGRVMDFRVSVRDNAVGPGCTQYEEAEVIVVGSAGPFKVNYPSLPGIEWEAFTTETVTWDVASTDIAPINCELVDIFLSVDGGDSYPIVLIADVPNNGGADILVPNSFTTDARVMVINNAGTFFDISNNDFTINGVSEGYYLNTEQSTISACVGSDVVFVIDAVAIGSFSEPITLSLQNTPAEVTATFGNTTISPGESTTLTLSNTTNVDAGALELVVLGTAGGMEVMLPLEVEFDAIDATNPQLISPADESEFVSTDVLFNWSEALSPNATYLLQLSLNPEFGTLLIDSAGIDINFFSVEGLLPETEYFWRVLKTTPCGDSEYSETFSFTTHTCFEFSSTDIPIDIPSNIAFVISDIEVMSSGVLTDVNVINISGTHFRTSDLAFKLRSPQGSEVDLLSNICAGDEDFSFGFDDSAEEESISCPPTSGQTYIPEEGLSDFNGEDSQGIWQLLIFDEELGASGTLDSWALQLCFANGSSFLLTANDTLINICQSAEVNVEITALPIFEFDEPIALSASNLPNGISVDFNSGSILANESSSATVTASPTAELGSSPIIITGVSGDIVFELELDLAVNDDTPQPTDLQMPLDQSIDLSSVLTFQWLESASPAAIYGLDIAYDEAFTELFGTIENIDTNFYTYAGLPPSENLFWRVRTNNGCAEVSSAVYGFTTAACVYNAAQDLPVNISSVPNTYPSEIDVSFSGSISTVKVFGLMGTHFRVGDLSARLISPSGTTVELFSAVCGSDNDFDLSFGDGGISEIDCPPTTGLEYAPIDSLASFAGEEANGVWILELEDFELSGGGNFNSWALEICLFDNSVGIFDDNKYKLRVFPNPTSGMVKIALGPTSEIDLIRVFDISGRLLESVNVQNMEWLNLNLTTYASGVYFIRATGINGNSSYKLIKEN